MTDTYTVNIHDVPPAGDLDPNEGWVNMLVQFLIDEDRSGAQQMVVGRTVFPPGGSSHEYHRHHSAEEFEVEVEAGDIVFHPRDIWHGFRNPSDTEEAEVIWAWGGAGSRGAAGYEARP